MDEEEEDFENDQDGEEEIGEDEEVRHIGNLMKPVVDLWGYEGPIWYYFRTSIFAGRPLIFSEGAFVMKPSLVKNHFTIQIITVL